MYGNTPIVAALLAAPGINVNVVDSYGHTALTYACMYGNTPIVAALLAAPGIEVTSYDVSLAPDEIYRLINSAYSAYNASDLTQSQSDHKQNLQTLKNQYKRDELARLSVSQGITEVVIEQCSPTDLFDAEKKVYMGAFLARTDVAFSTENLSKNFDLFKESFVKKDAQTGEFNVRAFRAKKNGKVIGLIIGALMGDHKGFLMTVAVLPSEQSKGVGKKLIDAFIASFDLKEVEAYIKKGNTSAEVLHKHLGFRPFENVSSLRGDYLDEPGYQWFRWSKPTI